MERRGEEAIPTRDPGLQVSLATQEKKWLVAGSRRKAREAAVSIKLLYCLSKVRGMGGTEASRADKKDRKKIKSDLHFKHFLFFF